MNRPVISADPSHPAHVAMTAAFQAQRDLVGHQQLAHEWTDNIQLLHNAMWRLNAGQPCSGIAIERAQRMRAALNTLVDSLVAVRQALEEAA